MDGFQKFILFAAIIILVLALIFIGVMLSKGKSQTQWPPIVPECPDYWLADGSGNNTTCVNVKNLGTCQQNTMNFNTPTFTGTNSLCAKYTWANNCGVSWDGITYGVNNPCQNS